MKAFFKEKGPYLLCLALLFGVTIVGVLAVRTVVNNVADLTQTRRRALEEENAWENEWKDPGMAVDKAQQDVPIATNTPAPGAAEDSSAAAAPTVKNGQSQSSAASSQASSSGAASASGASSAQQSEPVASSASDTGFAESPAAPVASSSGVEQGPSAPYSGQELVYNATLGDWRTHNGADYDAAPGDSIYAVHGGEVTDVYEDALWGGVVEVKAADGVQWKYCGVADPRVKKGDKISAGKELGGVGSVPSEATEKPHLHLECRKDNETLDPEAQR